MRPDGLPARSAHAPFGGGVPPSSRPPTMTPTPDPAPGLAPGSTRVPPGPNTPVIGGGGGGVGPYRYSPPTKVTVAPVSSPPASVTIDQNGDVSYTPGGGGGSSLPGLPSVLAPSNSIPPLYVGLGLVALVLFFRR